MISQNRSDFVYMAPPFIAYFGAYDQSGAMTWLLQAAYDQCRLYRSYLQDSSTKLWKHIELGSEQDDKFWATGNGWAAAGMLRVLQTIRNSNVNESFLNQQHDLLNWTEEIVKASWNYQVHIIPRDHIAPTSRPLKLTPRHLPAPSTPLSTTPARLQTPLRLL